MAATGPPPDLARLSLPERAELDALLAAEYGGPTLPEFIAKHFPRQPPVRHLYPLLGLFERARHEPIKVCVSWPPRHAKTTTLLRGLVWWLAHSPADTCGYATFSFDKARSESRKARDWARLVGVTLREDTQALSEWRTPEGGGLLAVGTKGLTGRGVSGVLVVDDPYQDREEADSVAIRERVWEWFTEVAFTRLEGGSIIVVHTRWSEDDLIGRLAKQQGWETLNLPAFAEENDPVGRAVGEPLWPERYSTDQLNEIRSTIGDWSFSALYQGHPRPRGAAVFGPAHYYDPATFNAEGCTIMIGGDPAATASTRADHSVAIVLAMRGWGAERVGYVLDVWRGQVEVPDYVERVHQMSEDYWHAPLAIEAVGGFKAVPQSLRRIDSTLQIIEPKMGADKFTRAQPAAAAWSQGRLLVPTSAPWLKVFLDEMHRFTGVSDAEDDQVDSLAHAWNALVEHEVPLVGIC